MDSQSEGETQPATQFEGGSDDAELLYEAKAILDERTRTIRGKPVGQYLVDWAGRDENSKLWDPTWQKKGDCTNELIREWKATKLRDPGIVGRWQAAEAERKKQEAESKRQARASASARRSGRASSRAGSVASSRGEKRKRSETADDVLTDVVTPRRRKRELKSVETAWSAGPISESAREYSIEYMFATIAVDGKSDWYAQFHLPRKLPEANEEPLARGRLRAKHHTLQQC